MNLKERLLETVLGLDDEEKEHLLHRYLDLAATEQAKAETPNSLFNDEDPPKRDGSIVVKPDQECMVKAFDGEDRVLTYKCAPCPACGHWLVVNPSHRYCEYCGQAVKFSV